MAEPLTPEQIADARAAIERAHEEVGEIARKGRDRWRMTIPADPTRDSDLILSTGLNAGEQAVAEVERLEKKTAVLVGRIEYLTESLTTLTRTAADVARKAGIR